jgi:nucleoside-diphosphate-sugar epimerase
MPLPVLGVAARVSEAVSKVTGRRFELTVDKYKEMRPDFYVYSNERARKRLGFQERVKIDEGMQRAVAWYREQGWL